MAATERTPQNESAQGSTAKQEYGPLAAEMLRNARDRQVNYVYRAKKPFLEACPRRTPVNRLPQLFEIFKAHIVNGDSERGEEE